MDKTHESVESKQGQKHHNDQQSDGLHLLYDFVTSPLLAHRKPDNQSSELKLDAKDLYNTCVKQGDNSLLGMLGLHTRSKEEQEKQEAGCYKSVLEQHQKAVGEYWNQVELDKSFGRLIYQFPPEFNGPPKPAHAEDKVLKTPSAKLPSANDMLDNAKELNRLAERKPDAPDFKPLQLSEGEFKQGYAREALNVGKKLGLTAEETEKVVMNVYAFECGGRGTYDLLSGVDKRLTQPDKPGHSEIQEARRSAHPISSAIGYNQIIMSTNLAIHDKEAAPVAERLRELAKDSPRGAELEGKAKLYENLQNNLHKELLLFAAEHPGRRHKYLDHDGNPRYKLYQDFAASHKPTASGLTGRQFSSALHALNLDGDLGPVIQARQLQHTMQHMLSPEVRANLTKLKGEKAGEYFGAAVEMANLAGETNGAAMLKPGRSHLPTVNFFDRKGYEANPIVQKRNAGQLLEAVYRVMHGANASRQLYGNAQFEESFRAEQMQK